MIVRRDFAAPMLAGWLALVILVASMSAFAAQPAGSDSMACCDFQSSAIDAAERPGLISAGAGGCAAHCVAMMPHAAPSGGGAGLGYVPPAFEVSPLSGRVVPPDPLPPRAA